MWNSRFGCCLWYRFLLWTVDSSYQLHWTLLCYRRTGEKLASQSTSSTYYDLEMCSCSDCLRWESTRNWRACSWQRIWSVGPFSSRDRFGRREDSNKSATWSLYGPIPSSLLEDWTRFCWSKILSRSERLTTKNEWINKWVKKKRGI